MEREYVLNTSGAPDYAHVPTVTPLDYAAALNAEQLAAVTAKPGPMLVIAGAGSGKTRTLTYRVAYLVEKGVAPESILLLTFTNKAAKEMLNRVKALLPFDVSRVWGGTFHSVGNRLLRRHADLLGWGRDFTIMDEDDAVDLVNQCMPAAGLDAKDKSMPKGSVLLNIFSLSVNKEQTIAKTVTSQFPYFETWVLAIERAAAFYQERKRLANLMDYDDLLSQPLRLFREHEQVRNRYQEQWRHVLVDEYQDTNKIQADFIDWCAGKYRQVMVVGDDAQSIYSWRGADVQNIMTFPERYKDATVVRIETNYRSSPEILEVANVTIAQNTEQFPKELRAARKAQQCAKPALICLQTSSQQAAFIAQRVQELHAEGVAWPQMAILYRSHYHSLEVQMELTRRGVPFELTSGLRFFEQAHIKDVGAFLRLGVNHRDELAFRRIASMIPGVGGKTAAKLWDQVAAGKSIGELKPPGKAQSMWMQFAATIAQIRAPEIKNRTSQQIELILESFYSDYMKAAFPNFQSRLEDITQLRAFADTVGTTEHFLAELSLLSNADMDAPSSEETEPEPESAPVNGTASSGDDAVVNPHPGVTVGSHEGDATAETRTPAGPADFDMFSESPPPPLAATPPAPAPRAMASAGGTQRDILRSVSRREQQQRRAEKSKAEPKMRLSTIHQAKGLEWKVVFVIMLNEGAFPTTKSVDSLGGEAEERRLFYVAVTRAEDELYLCYPQMRSSANYGNEWQQPSRFIDDLPRGLTNQWKIVPQAREW